jgi:hypothetical protein
LYWRTLISATVEDVAPTKVVLTFSSPNTAVANDFTIAGFTIYSHFWSGSVLTLTLTTEVIYGNPLVINYVPRNQTQAVTNNVGSYSFVDVFNGNDTTGDGTRAKPWLTLAKADSVLSLNAPLKLKYPNEKWGKAPAYWHTLRALYVMFGDGINMTTVYDVANGSPNGTIQPNGVQLAFQTNGVKLISNGTVDFGAGALAIGTGDQTVMVNVKKGTNNSGNHAIFANGSMGGVPGFSFALNNNKLNYQIRTAGVYVWYEINEAEPTNYVFAATVKRNNITGFRVFIDGVLKNSPGTDTTPVGSNDLTNSGHTYLGLTCSGGYYYNADWIKELRVYSTALSDSDVVVATTEIQNNASLRFPFKSGDYYAMGIGSTYGSNVVHLLQSPAYNGKFHYVNEVTYTGRPTTNFGNAKVLPLVKDKCNNNITPQVGEINWLMTHEKPTENSIGVAVSYNGLDWTYVTAFASPYGGQGDFFVDNNDPSDYHNIHYILFDSTSNPCRVFETHPTAADFSTWSTPFNFFSYGAANSLYNESVVLIGGVYYMLFNYAHYMCLARCTHDPWTAGNDWTITQTGDWAGLGMTESYSIFNTGGNSWILYYLYLGTLGVPSTYRTRYSISNDNLATWSAGVDITELCPPTLDYSIGVVRLK